MADERGTLALMRAVNNALPTERQLQDSVLEETFNQWWPKIKTALDGTPSAPSGHSIPMADSGLGLEYVAGSRGPALEVFRKYIDAEIKRGQAGRISMVGTSMRGFLVHAGGGFSGHDIFEEALNNKVELRLMLVNPEYGHLRLPLRVSL